MFECNNDPENNHLQKMSLKTTIQKMYQMTLKKHLPIHKKCPNYQQQKCPLEIVQNDSKIVPTTHTHKKWENAVRYLQKQNLPLEIV